MSETDETLRQRTYAGEEDGRWLADWLNENQLTAAGFRIKALLTVMHVLSLAARALLGEPKGGDLEELDSFLHRAWRSVSKVQAKSDGPADLHKLPPAEFAQLLLERVGLPKLRAHVAADFSGSGLARRAFFVLKADDAESAVVLRVLALSQRGILDRVRRCRHCGNFFFARFRHQHFCQTQCQQSQYRSSEEWKAHRREWAREYYRIKQKLTIKGEGI